MVESNSLSRTKGELLLVTLVLARSVSYVMTKISLRELQAFNLIGIRFLMAFFLLLPFTWKKLKGISFKVILKGMLLGALFTSVLGAEALGLKTASASSAAFLINMAIVFVPLFEAAIHRSLPKISIVISTLIAVIGVALLTLKGDTLALSEGEFLCLMGAALYACVLIVTDRFSHRDDPLTLGILQVGFMGLYCIIISFMFESPRLPVRPITWGMLLALATVCTCFGYTLQPLAQSRTTSERAGLLCALGPVGGALAGWMFLGENLTSMGILGMMLILFGMLFTRVYHNSLKHRGQKTNA